VKASSQISRRETLGQYFVGIDPGLTGALVVLDTYGTLAGWTRMPVLRYGKHRELDPQGIIDFLPYPIGKCEVAIEEVHAMPNQGVTSMFRFGQGFGILHGIISSRGITPHRPRPQEWQRWAFSADRTWATPCGKAEGTKAKAVAAAVANWPSLERPLAVKLNQGVADAALLAEYIRAMT